MARDDAALPPSGPPALRADHPALVVEDALAAAAPLSEGERPAGAAFDLRAAILYGWAIGAVSARSIVARAETDLGLRYLLRGARPSFSEIRRFREANRAALEAELGAALAVCSAAGLRRLGQLPLPRPPRLPGVGANPYFALARKLLDEAEGADLRDDLQLGAHARGDELPEGLGERATRQATFHRLAERHPAVRRPQRGIAAVRALLSAVAALALLVGGLLVIRWVGSASAEGTYTGQARIPVSAPAVPLLTPAAATPTPGGLDLVAASQEGVRLGIMALVDDDLLTARDFFFLATVAVPENVTAADRLRQVETALHIDERTDGWEQAVDDLAELRRLAPGSSAVLNAYVTALVRAGQAALAEGNRAEATQHCTEATRWLPARSDAQACAAAARAGTVPRPGLATPGVTPPPAPPAATPTRTPLPAATATPLAVANASPSPTVAPISEAPSDLTPLRLAAGGRCLPTADGARVLQIEGSVSADAAPVIGATAQVRIMGAGDRLIDASSFPIASPRFSAQRTVTGGGPFTVTVTVVASGYAPGEATLGFAC